MHKGFEKLLRKKHNLNVDERTVSGIEPVLREKELLVSITIGSTEVAAAWKLME